MNVTCTWAVQVLFELHPLKAGATPWNVVCCAYMAIFAAFWAWNLAEAVTAFVRKLPKKAMTRFHATCRCYLS